MRKMKNIISSWMAILKMVNMESNSSKTYNIFMLIKKFEDAKWIIRKPNLKDSQCNRQMKWNKKTNYASPTASKVTSGAPETSVKGGKP